MNPLRWKREHQLALLCAAVLEAGIALFLALHGIDPDTQAATYLNSHGQVAVFDYYWAVIGAYTVAGAIIGGAIVYIARLMWG